MKDNNAAKTEAIRDERLAESTTYEQRMAKVTARLKAVFPNYYKDNK